MIKELLTLFLIVGNLTALPQKNTTHNNKKIIGAEYSRNFINDDGSMSLIYFNQPQNEYYCKEHSWLEEKGDQFIKIKDNSFTLSDNDSIVISFLEKEKNTSLCESFASFGNFVSYQNYNSTTIREEIITTKLDFYNVSLFSDRENSIEVEDNGLLQLTNKNTKNSYNISFYLTDNFGSTIKSNKIDVSNNIKNNIITASFDEKLVNNQLVEPYTITSAIEPLNAPSTYSPLIQDKYIQVGVGGSYNTTTNKVGTSRLQFWDSFPSYETIYNITVPEINSAEIINASLTLIKSSGGSSPIMAHKITNKSFNEIDGLSSLSTETIGTSIISGSTYVIDLTNAIKESINSNEDYLCISLSSLGTPEINFYSLESNSSIPSFVVTYAPIGTYTYGNAEPYQPNTSTSMNCFGYVLGINQYLVFENGDNVIDTEENLQLIISEFMNIVQENGYNIRIIYSYNEDIYHNERRILLRLYDYESFFYDFHVAMQHNDGGWTHKPGSTPSRCLSTDQNPEDDDLEWEIIKPDGFKYSYNSPFIYFAIS